MADQESVREWIVALGLPALGVAMGLGVMGYANYWGGVILVYIAVGFLIADLWWVRFPALVRSIGTLVGIGCLVFFTTQVFAPAPLKVQVNVYSTAGYLPNQAGIRWNPQFGDLRIEISNPTERDYDNIDLTFEAGDLGGAVIMQMRQLSALPGVNLLADTASEPQPFKAAWLMGWSHHRKIKIPLISTEQQPTRRYRILCAKLPRKAIINLIGSIAILNSSRNGILPKQLFAKFHQPSDMRIVGGYIASNKPMWIDRSFQ
jgi:hypothetical protein